MALNAYRASESKCAVPYQISYGRQIDTRYPTVMSQSQWKSVGRGIHGCAPISQSADDIVLMRPPIV
jgi:hypothetical protein